MQDPNGFRDFTQAPYNEMTDAELAPHARFEYQHANIVRRIGPIWSSAVALLMAFSNHAEPKSTPLQKLGGDAAIATMAGLVIVDERKKSNEAIIMNRALLETLRTDPDAPGPVEAYEP